MLVVSRLLPGVSSPARPNLPAWRVETGSKLLYGTRPSCRASGASAIPRRFDVLAAAS